MTPALVWFCDDPRLADDPALAAAVGRGPVLPVFIWPSEEIESWFPGAASRWWLNRLLGSLRADLERRGSRLIIGRGPAERALIDLIRLVGATAVYRNHRYEPSTMARRKVEENLRDRGSI